MNRPQEPRRSSPWLLVVVALPVLCCAWPALLAALGAGSLGVLLGGATGRLGLALLGLAVVCVACAVIAYRRTRR